MPKNPESSSNIEEEKIRAEAETELIREGAEYAVDNEGRKGLVITEEMFDRKSDKEKLKKLLARESLTREEMTKLDEELEPVKQKIKEWEKQRQEILDVEEEKATLVLASAMRAIGRAMKGGDEKEQEEAFNQFELYLESLKGKKIKEEGKDFLFALLKGWGEGKIYPREIMKNREQGLEGVVSLDAYNGQAIEEFTEPAFLGRGYQPKCISVFETGTEKSRSGCTCDRELQKRLGMKRQ